MSNDLPQPSPTPNWDVQFRGEPPASPAGAPGGGLSRYVGAVLRYKWVGLALVVVCTAAGVFASRFAKPSYVAQVTLWVEAPTRDDGPVPIQSDNLLENAGWIDLMRSYAVLDSAVLQQKLYLSYEFPDRMAMANFQLADRFRPGQYVLEVLPSGTRYHLKTPDGISIEEGVVGDSIGRQLGFHWQPLAADLPKGKVIEFEVNTPRDAARRLNEQLNIRMAREANFMHVELKSANPWRLATVLNAVADRYVVVATELKRAKVSELVEILESQRQYAERKLNEAELALEGFRVGTITLPSDDVTPLAPGLELTRDPVFRNFFELKIEREQLQRDQQSIRAGLAAARDSNFSIDAFSTIASVGRSPELNRALTDLAAKRAELNALLQQYTREYGLVQRAQREIDNLETNVIPKYASDLLHQVETRTAVLDDWIQSAGRDLQQIPPRVIEEARLRRQVEIAERLHTNLRERYEEARLAAATASPDVRVLDHAVVPQQPVENPGVRFILMGFVAGVTLAIGFALLMEMRDPRVRYPDQVSHGMRLSILGALPDLKARTRSRSELKAAQAVEALREVRFNLTHSFPAGSPMLVTISSAGTGDGKTFISCNLALAFADCGKRTLVIDGDTRRGMMHRMFDRRRSPGLTDYLTGAVASRDIIQQTASPSLDFIGRGSVGDSALSMIGGERMHDLLGTLSASYDVIIIDSPPFGAGADAYQLAVATQNLVIVVRSGKTDRMLTEAKLLTLDRLPVRVLGAVLNGIDDTPAYRYYSYLEGYQAPDEPLAIASETRKR